MEVLEVETIVPCLAVACRREVLLAALELDGHHDLSDDDHGVDTTAETRHVELEEQRGPALKRGERLAKDVDLLDPRELLCGLERTVWVGHREVADDLLRRGVQEVVDGCAVVGGRPPRRGRGQSGTG